jgi:flavodoxin I
MKLDLRAILIAALFSPASAWISLCGRNERLSSTLSAQPIGIFYGTSTGSTQTIADLLHQAFGPETSSEPIDVDTLEDSTLAQAFAQHESLIVGTPTWNTGADSERSGTGWDELYYDKLPALKDILQGKKVAVFGLGDQQSYAENYADASGELFDVFSELGCTMLGSWSMEGYEHEDSKAIRGDKFCGLLLDVVNQEELSESRVNSWTAQLIKEGILEGQTSNTKSQPAATASLADSSETLPYINGQRQALLPDSIADARDKGVKASSVASYSTGGFTPHTNHATGKTMWTSADGRQSFVTLETTAKRSTL